MNKKDILECEGAEYTDFWEQLEEMKRVQKGKSAVSLIPQLADLEPETDAALRAITPPGFAKAFFEANP